jgi:hypothetical protein
MYTWHKIWSGAPSLAANTRLLSFNQIQPRVVTGLLTGHSTLRRHLYVMGLTDSPFCRRCGAEEESSAHVLCECEALATLKPTWIHFSLDPENIRVLWTISNFTEGKRLLWLGHQSKVGRAVINQNFFKYGKKIFKTREVKSMGYSVTWLVAESLLPGKSANLIMFYHEKVQSCPRNHWYAVYRGPKNWNIKKINGS